MDCTIPSSSNSLSPVTTISAFPFKAVEMITISSLSLMSILARVVFSGKMESWVNSSIKSDIISWGVPILAFRIFFNSAIKGGE